MMTSSGTSSGKPEIAELLAQTKRIAAEGAG